MSDKVFADGVSARGVAPAASIALRDARDARVSSERPLGVDRLDALPAEERARLLRRVGTAPPGVIPVVRGIVADVRARGDAALREHTERLDGVRLDRLEVSPEELGDALRAVEPRVLRAIEAAMASIEAFHRTQLAPQPPVETRPGVVTWREWRPLDRVGLYVAGGRAAYPSTLLMQAVSAGVAGCPEVVACSPPGRDGLLPPEILAAASLAGVSRVFKLGGAQAVAAMAYGTETVPRVRKLFGAGSIWVTAAKLEVYPDADVDLPAGPSEILVVADGTPDPRLVAADLLAQAEHGPDSACVLVTPEPALAEAVAAEVARQLEDLPRAALAGEALRRYGRALVVDSIAEAVVFANEYAPEHLALAVEAPERLLPLVRNAGSVFLGIGSPVAAGDYATGTNHVLPTGGAAAAWGPLSVESFGRWIEVQRLSPDGLRGLRETITALAGAEGLEGHARSVAMRFEG